MSSIWYIYSNDIVSGPFSTENVETGLTEKKWADHAMIWWKGQRDWVPVDTWKKNLPSIMDTLKTNVQTYAWYVEYLGTQKGPMNSKELFNFVQTNGIIGSCRVWAVGMDRWMTIFEIPELLTFFGITRRKHARAPLKGDLLIHREEIEGSSLTAHAGSISIGGIGIKGVDSFKTGDGVNIEVKSPLLVSAIQANAIIVYTNAGGYTGLEFRKISKQHETIISDYVNQFKS